MIHVYAVARDPIVPAALVGLEGAVVAAISCGPLHAVVSAHDRAPTPDRAAALTHASVIASLAELAPILPVRFGVVHSDVATLRDAMRGAAADLLAALDRVGGHVEFVLRHARSPLEPARTVSRPRRAIDARAPGRSYLESRLEELRATRRAEQMASAELRALTSSLDGHAVLVLEHQGSLGPERCYLVDDAVLARFTAAARQCLDDHEDLVLGGPWPPYTFATEELGS